MKQRIFIIILVVVVAVAGTGIFWWGYAEQAVSKGMGTAAANCTRNPEPSAFDAAPYYTGPLFETHLHIPSVLAPPKIITDQLGMGQNYASLGEAVTMEKIICLMDREHITRAVAFFPTFETPLMRTPFINIARESVKRFGERIIPFAAPVPFITPTPTPKGLRTIFEKSKGAFIGYGEITFYWDAYEGLSPDDPMFLESYKVTGDHGGFVMIHPDNGHIRALETVFKENPDITFILHGMNEGDPFNHLLGTYENAYYSLDSPGLEPFFNAESKGEFIQEMEERFDVVLERAVRIWRPMIEANPEKVMWGTDRLTPWSFDEEVGIVLEEYYRAFIGRLDPAVQELYAYKNADQLFRK